MLVMIPEQVFKNISKKDLPGVSRFLKTFELTASASTMFESEAEGSRRTRRRDSKISPSSYWSKGSRLERRVPENKVGSERDGILFYFFGRSRQKLWLFQV